MTQVNTQRVDELLFPPRSVANGRATLGFDNKSIRDSRTFFLSIPQLLSYTENMQCPSCNAAIQDDLVIKAAASINGSRGRGDCKRRDSKLMSECGKKGGWPKGRPRKKHAA
jgi:hypothetical protein